MSGRRYVVDGRGDAGMLWLSVEKLRARKGAEFGKIELKVTARLAVATRIESGTSQRWRLADACAVHRHSFLVLAEFGLQTLDLGTENAVLVLVGFLRLGQAIDFGLEVFEMLLLALSEGALGSTILSLALLLS